MDKKFVMGIAAMAALTLVSCSSDDLDSLSDNSSKNEAISFDGYLGRSAVAVNGSRGSVETAKTLETNGFGVFSKYTGTASFPDFANQKVTYSNSKWTYTPLKFWPAQGDINFLAYAPYDKDKKLKENKTTFDYKVADQKDLLWANSTGHHITANIASTKETVKFQFKHALSRLGYTIKLSGDYTSKNVKFTLNKITLAGSAPESTTKAFYTGGTIDLSTGNWTLKDATKQDFEWFSGTYQNLSTTASNPDTNNNYLFVIPQDFSKDKAPQKTTEVVDELYVIVQYTITYPDGVGTQTNTVYKQLKQNFLQGKAYMLNLTIGLPIEFDIDVKTGVEDWGNDNVIPDGKDIDTWDGIE